MMLYDSELDVLKTGVGSSYNSTVYYPDRVQVLNNGTTWSCGL